MEYDVLGADADSHLFDMWLVWSELGDGIARRAWLGQGALFSRSYTRFI